MQKLRLILLPFSWIYGFVTFLRNLFYDVEIFKSYLIPKKSICVGNLAIGGTGKSPHVSYLVNLLKENTKISILSRGYGRTTKGFILANENSKGTEIGDEPKMYLSQFHPNVNVIVCEKRAEGVQKINSLFPDNDLIILDDAFQHRAVKAEINILLTDYSSLFSSDFVIPAGNLREWRIGRKRAKWIIVTKCPENISELEKQSIARKLKFKIENIFFSSIVYGKLISFDQKPLPDFKNILIVTGISNPSPLINHLSNEFTIKTMKFPDHHNYTIADIDRIHQNFDTFASESKVIITTEKDYMRFSEMISKTKMNDYPWFYQSIEVKIDREDIFNNLVKQYVDTI